MNRQNIVLQIMAAFLTILCLALINGCGEDEEDEFVNPKSTVITPQGGTAISADGNVTVEVPAGAVSSDTTIIVGESPSIPLNTIGKAYKFGPDNLQFTKPATIHLKYNKSEVPVGVRDADLAMGRESDGKWVEISSYMIDAPNHTVSGSVSGFSSYGIFCSYIPSTSAEYWNLVNQQVCIVLDGIREVNTGMLMAIRANERDFTQEYDPGRTDYTEEEIYMILSGFAHIGEAIGPMREAMEELEILEKAAMGVGAPAHPNKSNNIISDAADYVNSIAFPLLEKLWDFTGAGDFVADTVPLVAAADKISYEMKVKIVAFIGMVIDEMDRSKNDSGIPTDYYCRRACELNKIYEKRFGEALHEATGSEICVQDKEVIRAKAFNALNQSRSAPDTFKLFSFLSGDLAQCFPDWMEELRAYIIKAAADVTEAGGKMYWDAVKSVVIRGDIADAVDKAGYVDLVNEAYKRMPAPGLMAPGSVVVPAHAVILLVPHDMENLPILVTAAVAENGIMRIPEPYVGTYKLHFYSKGNMPIVLDNVIISAGGQSIEMPDFQPLEGNTIPQFTAMTTGDPEQGTNPPPWPACSTCMGGYNVTHKARTFGEINAPGGVWLEYDTEVQFSFEFEGSEAWVEVPYIIHKTFFHKVDEFGGKIIRTPSSFSLLGTAEWHIRRKNVDGQPCYFANISIIEEETQNSVASYQDGDGNVFIINPDVKVTTWGDVDIFPSGKLNCGDLPITYEFHWEADIGPVGGEKDITVTIEDESR